MHSAFNRRDFLKQTAGAGAMALAAGLPPAWAQPKPIPRVRVGLVGAGLRGTGHIADLLKMPGVEIKAVCDIVPSRVENVQNMVQKAGQPRPASFTRGELDFKRLCAEADLDIVYVATPWEWHTQMCVEAMKNGKHAATEVPAAITLEECWELVETAEKTGLHCIMLENACYDRVELMILNMVRKGLFGELLHAECGYLHDLRDIKFGPDHEGEWRLNHSIRRNADLYPTHGLGPVAQWLDINRGNLFDHMVTMASKSRSLHEYAVEKFGAGSPQAKLEFKLGDVVSTLIRTRAGQTILVVHDTNSPRPYSRKILLQGTRGLLEKYPKPVIYLEGKSPAHQWEDLLAKYAKEWEHPLWAELEEKARGGGHGGMDYVMTYRLIQCLQRGEPFEMDVYDAAALSAVVELSERSIANRSRTVDFPDFTRGRWRSRQPVGVVRA